MAGWLTNLIWLVSGYWLGPGGGGGAVGWLAASSLHSWQNGYGNHASSSAVIFLQVQRTGIFGGMGEINYFHLTGSVSQDYRPLFLS